MIAFTSVMLRQVLSATFMDVVKVIVTPYVLFTMVTVVESILFTFKRWQPVHRMVHLLMFRLILHQWNCHWDRYKSWLTCRNWGTLVCLVAGMERVETSYDAM